MPQNFIPCDRDQRLLMPPSLSDWLPPDHLVWFVIDSVGQMDLSAFYARHRDDGWGRAAYDPQMMVTLLLYAYAKGIRSAREIERRCVEDVAFRVITAGRRVDHATICRFRTRNRDALSELFVDVLGLCAYADIVHPKVVAIDGTKLEANASGAKNVTREQLEEFARHVFDDAERIDAEEDELYGDRRGDEIPEHLVDRTDRIEWIKQKLAEKEAINERRKPSDRGVPRVNTTDPDSAVQKTPHGYTQGYNGQLAVTEDQVIVAADLTADNHDCDQLEPMIIQVQSNLDATSEEDAIGTVVADAGYFSDDNATLDVGVDLLIAPVATRNLDKAIATRTDPIEVDEAGLRRWQEAADAAHQRADVMAAYTAKQVTTGEAAQVLGVAASYIKYMSWHHKTYGRLPKAQLGQPPPLQGRQVMLRRLAQPGARDTYAVRARTIEPVFGQLKQARGMRRFVHRGRAACRCEWRMMATAHNLRKLWGRLSEPLVGSFSAA